MNVSSVTLQNRSWKEFYLGSSGKKRYCGSRLSLVPFVLLHVGVLLLVLAIILVPIAYFVLVPNMIKSLFASASLDSVSIGTIYLRGLSPESMDFEMYVGYQGAGSVRLVGPTTLSLSDGTSNLGTILLKNDLTFSSLTATLGSINLSNATKISQIISCTQSCSPLIMSGSITVSIAGTVWYRDLPISKTFSFQSNSPSVLPSSIYRANLNSHINSLYTPAQLTTLGDGLPSLYVASVKNLSIGLSQMTWTMNVILENPLMMDMTLTLLQVGFGGSRASEMVISMIPSDPSSPIHFVSSPSDTVNPLMNVTVNCTASFTLSSLLSLTGAGTVFGPFVLNSTQSLVSVVTQSTSIPLSLAQTQGLLSGILSILTK